MYWSRSLGSRMVATRAWRPPARNPAAPTRIAQAIAPLAVDYCAAAHLSAEPGHAIALERLGLTPYIELELRLGEGTGATLFLGHVEAATRILAEMATFAEAGVPEQND